MAKVRLLGGKPLLVGGKVALSDDCCCDQGGGGCCIDGVCSVLSQTDCEAAGGQYLGDGTNCDIDPCGDCPPDAVRWRCCFCSGGCSNLTRCLCDFVGGGWNIFDTCEGCSGGVPCCTARHVQSRITGTVEYFDGDGVLQCTWDIDDTLEYDSSCDDSGCDGEGYPGCCVALAEGGVGPVTIDSGTPNEHTVELGVQMNDNFNGTVDIIVGMQIDPNYDGTPGQNCLNAATVSCTDNSKTNVDCNGSFVGSKNCTGTAGVGGQTHYNLDLSWSIS